MNSNSHITKHYSSHNLFERLLVAIGTDVNSKKQLSYLDFSELDHLHPGGVTHTRDFAELANVTPKSQVIDFGCGLGGPARILAVEFDAKVTGVDLTEDYIIAGRQINTACELSDCITLKVADATATGLPSRSFDFAMTQFVLMNIPDKNAFFAEAFRVLKPGGKLLYYGAQRGTVEPIIYPVLWAGEESISFMTTPDELKESAQSAGFKLSYWEDKTEYAIDWFEKSRGTNRIPLRSFGDDQRAAQLQERAANVLKNFAQNRTVAIEAVWTKP